MMIARLLTLSLTLTLARGLKVVAFHGSARKASCNAGVIRYVAAAAARAAPELSITVIDPSTWPLFNNDLIAAGEVPGEIKAAIESTYEADAVIISTAEYNYSMSPITTNAVAWLSKAPLRVRRESSRDCRRDRAEMH